MDGWMAAYINGYARDTSGKALFHLLNSAPPSLFQFQQFVLTFLPVQGLEFEQLELPLIPPYPSFAIL